MDSKGTNEEIQTADEEVTAAAAEIERCEVSANKGLGSANIFEFFVFHMGSGQV